MKFITITLLFAVALALATAEKKCRDVADCEAGECCLARKSDIFGFRRGKCTKLGEKGESCSDNIWNVLGRHLIHCPCREGLICEPTEIQDSYFGTIWANEKCTDGATDKPEETTATEESRETTAEE